MRPLHSSSDYKKLPSDDEQMDDLLFALKTHNFSGESVASDESELNLQSRQDRLAAGLGGEHFEHRRISIADTHL